MLKRKAFFTKLFQWEHWPTYMFYVPLIPYYIFCALKAKNLVFYLATNPCMKYSGNGSESKLKTLQLIPQQYTPKSILATQNIPFTEILKTLKYNKIAFPLIAKPDVGFRGYLVKKINSEKELEEYLLKNDIDIILQEFIDLPNECGIFYYRLPNNTHGTITSITLKKFLKITGDGNSTLSELICKDKRAFLYWDILKNLHEDKIDNVLDQGEMMQLSVIGNHSKGTQFINGNHLINNDLTLMLEGLLKQINGWNFGRLDLKYNNFDEFTVGKNFKILELNGIIAEPTHIYDPSKCSYPKAVKTIKDHWKIIDQIATLNHKNNNIPYPKVIPYLKDMLRLRKHSKKIIRLNKTA